MELRMRVFMKKSRVEIKNETRFSLRVSNSRSRSESRRSVMGRDGLSWLEELRWQGARIIKNLRDIDEFRQKICF